jgi:hypothetical protein
MIKNALKRLMSWNTRLVQTVDRNSSCVWSDINEPIVKEVSNEEIRIRRKPDIVLEPDREISTDPVRIRPKLIKEGMGIVNLKLN